MAKKPWRTVQFGEDTGRFTRQQYVDAVRAVRERNEARNKQGRQSVDGQLAYEPVKPKSVPRKS
jgi:hypothetical protein